MSVLKPFNHIYKSSLNGEMLLVKFNCQNCGSDKCYRPKISYGWTFLEGFYVCVNCKRKVTYYDNDFVIQTYNKQFELFKNDNN